MGISLGVSQHRILSCDPVTGFLEAREMILIGKK